MTNFTRGRWTVSKDSVTDVVIRNMNGDIVHYVCEVEWSGKSEDEIRADANLIASAPELYEKLKNCADFLYSMSDCESGDYSHTAWQLLQTVEAVLARAEGKEEN